MTRSLRHRWNDAIRERSPESLQHGLARCLDSDPAPVVERWCASGLIERALCEACELSVGGPLDEALRARSVRLPASARIILNEHRRHLGASNRRRSACLRPILRALHEADVPTLLLKGAALNATVYADDDLRGMSDVDLLIRQEDSGRADRILNSLGCRRESEPLHEGLFPRFYYERPYLTSDRPALRLDLHVRPFRPVHYRRTVPPEAMWLAPRRIIVADEPAWTPSIEETLIHLCVHAAGHGLSQLRWLHDVVRFCEHYAGRIDFGRVSRLSSTWRLTYPMSLAVRRIEEVFPKRFAAFAGLLQPAPALRPSLKDRIAIHQAPHDAVRPLRHVLVDLLCLPGVRDRAAYLRMHVFPGREHLQPGAAGPGALGWIRAQSRRLLRALARG
ncbi:MAG: hypothetical protein FLDDKLPJ_01013 [Phycisphaerae bacterium]|nr:hypothetical protein [Phycisphaerae bacterium]